jgi:acetate kinase
MADRPALVLNAGSSSVKAALLGADGAVLWRGHRAWRPQEAAEVLESWLPDALAPWLGEGAVAEVLAFAGHRVVHGGERFTVPTRLTPTVRSELAALVPLAPLHNGPALQLIDGLERWAPALPQWACFDTAFHATLPPEARTYAIPATWRQAGLRRFGFHGLNHEHVAETVADSDPDARRLISCHLGAGCSLCAVLDGRSIATTMGFTPLEGLVMASRSGSIDPGLLLHQLRQGLGADAIDHALHQESGLLGLSGLSGDMATLRQAAADGHGGEVIALSGGIGEHDAALRRELVAALAWLGPFRLRVVPADEEGLIARRCRGAAASGG